MQFQSVKRGSMCMHTLTHTHTRTHARTHARVHMHTCMHARPCTHNIYDLHGCMLHSHTHTHRYTQTDWYTHIHMTLRQGRCMHAHTHTHTHSHTCTQHAAGTYAQVHTCTHTYRGGKNTSFLSILLCKDYHHIEKKLTNLQWNCNLGSFFPFVCQYLYQTCSN